MSESSAPVAVVSGKPLLALPTSLYVPPDAMQVFLASFEGPLDLLHYLIRREQMDVRDIPMAELTKQYLTYVDDIVANQLELAADYLLMSATLIEIKSALLLPVPEEQEEEAEDPRAALVERLLRYSRISKAAQELRGRAVVGRDLWHAKITLPNRRASKPRIAVQHLHMALLGVMERKKLATEFEVNSDTYSVREAMAHLFVRLRTTGNWLFSRLLGEQHATKLRVGMFFQAVLQMAKEQLVHIEQHDDSEIQVTPRLGNVGRKR